MGPDSPYFLWEYFKKYKKNKESFQKLIIFSYLNFLEFQKNEIFGPIKTPYFLYHISGILL